MGKDTGLIFNLKVVHECYTFKLHYIQIYVNGYLNIFLMLYDNNLAKQD